MLNLKANKPYIIKSDGLNVWENLANAIILRATEDYQKAKHKLSRNPKDRYAHNEIILIEQFFMSGYFSAITNLDPHALIERLNKTDLKPSGDV